MTAQPGKCVGLAFRRSRVRASMAGENLVVYNSHLHRAICGALEVLPCVECGVTVSQLNLPSLTPLSVASCGLLQLGGPHLSITSSNVALLQVVDY